MRFNFLKFLENNGIHFITSGPNVANGNVNIKCPWCGVADSSEHLGINIETGFWGCWRSTSHRGRKPHRLVQRLLGCSFERAQQIVGTEKTIDISDFEKLANDPDSIFTKDDILVSKSKGLKMPDIFKTISKKTKASTKFWDYLVTARGFKEKDVNELIDLYDLRYCVSGNYTNRLIFPIYDRGRLVCWTGRSIDKASLRYLTLSHKEITAKKRNEPLARENIKHLVYNKSEIMHTGGRILFITEGPFDALKLDFYGRKYDCRATCLFSMTLQREQEYVLSELSKVFDKLVVLLDQKEQQGSIVLTSALTFIKAFEGSIPFIGVEDPGDLNRRQIKIMCNMY